MRQQGYGAVKKIMIPTISAIVMEQSTPNFAPFFSTLVLSGAEVLADKGSQRQCKACDRQEAKSLDL